MHLLFIMWSFHFHNRKLANWRQWQGLCAPCHSTWLLSILSGHLMTVRGETRLLSMREMTARDSTKEMLK